MKLFFKAIDLVVWPDRAKLKVARAKKLLKTVRLMVDFDGTITELGTMTPRNLLCGQPLAEFLGGQPFLVQTFNPSGAMEFFRQHPHLPQPELILAAPVRFLVPGMPDDVVGKDFSQMGLEGKIIVDDMEVGAILAPGCTVTKP